MKRQTVNSFQGNSLKRLELPISKFNNIAIPHHLDLLKRHKSNIKKYQALRDWDQVYKEQINASRIVKQLKQLLCEIDSLREQVDDNDMIIFDQLTVESRNNTLEAIKEYSELEFHLPIVNSTSYKEEDKPKEDPCNTSHIQLNTEDEELQRQINCLHAWNALQNDLEQLHELFVDFNKIVHEHRSYVDKIEENIETTHTNVQVGEKSLVKAVKYTATMYPTAGALIGFCVGGPIGLVAGVKIGGLAAIGGGMIGFTSGKVLKRIKIKNQ